jgi:hypothetical protein
MLQPWILNKIFFIKDVVSAITLSELEFVDQTGRGKKTNPIKITITRAGALFLIFSNRNSGDFYLNVWSQLRILNLEIIKLIFVGRIFHCNILGS